MEEKWTVFSLNLGVLPQKPDTMSFPSRDSALKHACSLPPEVKILYIENTEGQRIQAEEVEKLCRFHSLLREYRTQQQFSRFEWDEIERFVTKLERTQHTYAELVGRVDNYVADVIRRRERKRSRNIPAGPAGDARQHARARGDQTSVGLR